MLLPTKLLKSTSTSITVKIAVIFYNYCQSINTSVKMSSKWPNTSTTLLSKIKIQLLLRRRSTYSSFLAFSSFWRLSILSVLLPICHGFRSSQTQFLMITLSKPLRKKRASTSASSILVLTRSYPQPTVPSATGNPNYGSFS